jgi:hypothetical protein
MNEDRMMTVIHAETERLQLIQQAVSQHKDRLAAEMRRFEEELSHINDVYKLRTGGQ